MSEAGIINAQPRPRVLIMGFDDDEELRSRIAALAPTSKHISGFFQVRHDEWDVLVTDRQVGLDLSGRVARVSPHIFVIFCAPSTGSMMTVEASIQLGKVEQRTHHSSIELRRALGESAAIGDLTHAQLEPMMITREFHDHFVASKQERDAENPIQFKDVPGVVLEPFIMTAGGAILAGRYKRSERAETWMLPADTLDLVPWIVVAFREWSKVSPERFPHLPDWSELPDWMTDDELDVAKLIESIEVERSGMLQHLERRERQARSFLALAGSRASIFERALLSEQSDQLVAAVQRAFEEIGFSVSDIDLQRAGRPAVEDLQIKDSSEPEWLALCEVKGYSKGAKTEGITQLMRDQHLYQASSGMPADALWYVPNQFRGRDPRTRRLVLQGNDEDIDAFAEIGGLVIDTVQLFTLLMAVRRGTISRYDARRLLRDSRGRLALP